MGITEAIARVKAGAKKAGLDSALASLGAGLKSSAIPAPLRPAASRIASLIGAQRTEPRDVASLERALEHAHAGPHGPADVCPFTGLRADGSVADASAAKPANDVDAAPVQLASRAEHVPAPASAELSGIQPVLKLAPLTEEPAQPAAAAPIAESEPEPVPAAALEAGPTPLDVGAPSEGAELVQPPAPSAQDGGARPQKAQSSSKEKVAGERSGAKTTARSPNKSASKQTNGRAPSNRKKS